MNLVGPVKVILIMTEQDKQLLLKDLCARLHYGVKIKTSMGDGILCSIDYIPDGAYLGVSINGAVKDYHEFQYTKPYLRPMSSMTEEEKNEVVKLGVCYDGAFHNDVYDVGTSMEDAFLAISWLLERHFDINYLINKGLALEAKEGMYKTE